LAALFGQEPDDANDGGRVQRPDEDQDGFVYHRRFAGTNGPCAYRRARLGGPRKPIMNRSTARVDDHWMVLSMARSAAPNMVFPFEERGEETRRADLATGRRSDDLPMDFR